MNHITMITMMNSIPILYRLVVKTCKCSGIEKNVKVIPLMRLPSDSKGSPITT